MKYAPLLVLLFSLSFNSCFVFDFDDQGVSRPTKKNLEFKNLSGFRQQAIYDMTSFDLLKKQDEYLNKVLVVSGYIVEQTYLEDKSKNILVSGGSGLRGISIMVELDHPLPTQKNMEDATTILTTGHRVRVLARFTGVKEFMFETGEKRTLPIGECIAVFLHSDATLKSPIWYWQK